MEIPSGKVKVKLPVASRGGAKLKQIGVGCKKKFCSMDCKNKWGNAHRKS